MNNPYLSSTVNLDFTPADAGDTYQPYLAQAEGRIGRLRFVAYTVGPMVLLTLLFVALNLLIGRNVGTLPAIVSSICMFGTWFVMARRRLHDMGRSGWWTLVSLVPLVNLAFMFWLLLAPGEQGENDYGPPSVPNSTAMLVVGTLCSVIGAIGMALVLFGFTVGMMAGYRAAANKASISSGF